MRLPSLHSHPGRRAWHRSSTTPAGAQKYAVAPAPKQPSPAPPGRSAHQRRLRNGTAFAAVLSVLMGALILAVPGLRTVTHRVAHANPGWIALAVALELASCVGYVVAFVLVFPAAPRRVAARIAWAEMGFGAVVPIGGAGGFALGGWMLHQHGLSIREIARRSAVLFWLTSAVNVCALILAGLTLATALLPGPRNPLLTLVPAAVGTLVLVCFHALPTITGRTGQHGRIGTALRATAVTVTDTEQLLRRPSWRLAGALAYLGADMAVLCSSDRRRAPGRGAGARLPDRLPRQRPPHPRRDRDPRRRDRRSPRPVPHTGRQRHRRRPALPHDRALDTHPRRRDRVRQLTDASCP
jgi:MFS family permease